MLNMEKYSCVILVSHRRNKTIANGWSEPPHKNLMGHALKFRSCSIIQNDPAKLLYLFNKFFLLLFGILHHHGLGTSSTDKLF